MAALAALLLQTPLSIVLADARRGRRFPRTALAWRFVVGYGALLAAALAAAGWAAGTLAPLGPALLAAPLVGLQLAYDARQRGRELLPEAAGALALGALVAVVALAGGVGAGPALGLWALLAARTLPSILYVRARLRLERGRAAERAPTWAAHGAALLAVAAATLLTPLPWWVAAPYAALGLRAVLGLSRFRVPAPAKVVGFRELAYGASVALVVGIGARAAGVG